MPLLLLLILDSSSCGTNRRGGDGGLLVAESLTGSVRLDFRVVWTGSTANRLVVLVVDSGCGNCRLGCGEDAIADQKLRVDDAGADTSSQTDGFSP